MLYNLGYKSELELNTVQRSDPFVITGDDLVSISVNRGTLIVNNVNVGPSTSTAPGSVVEVEASSGSQFATPTFVQFTQNGELEGVFCLINRADELFVYNDALNGKYAFEVLSDSTWTPLDDGKMGILNPDLSYTDITPKSLDIQEVSTVRNKLHILDYYLDHINVFTLSGSYLGRVEHSYKNPIDTATLYNLDTAGRIVTAFAFEGSNKVVLYSSSYSVLAELDVASPTGIASNQNRLYVMQRGSTQLLCYEVEADGTVTSLPTIDIANQPHRLYTLGSYLSVLTETSIELYSQDGSLFETIALQPFASSMAYDVEGQRLFVTHRQERKITKINLDFDNGHTQSTKFFANQGYLDAVAYNRFTDTFYVSDVVNREIVEYSSNLEQVNIFDLGSRHSYEMYLSASGNQLLFSSLYPTIDERLIIGDGNPDSQEYFDVENIGIGQSVSSPAYTLSGVRDPVTLFLFPDDNDISVQVETEQGSFSSGTVIELGQEFKFVVALPNNRPRSVEFVLGQSVYSFYANPDSRRLVPRETGFSPLEDVKAGETFRSARHILQDLDEPIVISTDSNSDILKNSISVGNSAEFDNGDEIVLRMQSSSEAGARKITELSYGGMFYSQWVITTATIDPPVVISEDFIDVYNADLGQQVTSDPVSISVSEPVELILTSSYEAQLLINQQVAEQPYIVQDNDVIQLRLNTRYFYETQHQLTVSWESKSLTWDVYTLPAYPVIPLEFGYTGIVTLGDYLTSDSVLLESVPEGQAINVTIPRNVYPFVNGQPYSFGQNTSILNYRGVLRYPTVIQVNGQDVIQLKGYALGPYGSVTQHKVQAGISVGYWSIKSLDTEGTEPTRDIIYTQDYYAALLQILDTRVIDHFDSSTQNLAYSESDLGESLSESGHSELVDTHTSERGFRSSLLVEGLDHSYSVYTKQELVAEGALFTKSFTKSSNGIISVPDQRVPVKSSTGYWTVDAPSSFEKSLQSISLVDAPQFIKQTPGLEITQEPRVYELHGFKFVPGKDSVFERQAPIPTISATYLYQRTLPVAEIELDIEYQRTLPVAEIELDIEYQKGLSPNVNNLEIEYNKGLAPAVNQVTLSYQARHGTENVQFDIEYQKGRAPDVINLDGDYTKQLSQTIALTPQNLITETDFSSLLGPKTVTNKNVNGIVAALPKTVFDGTAKNVVAGEMYTHSIVSTQNIVAELGGQYSHRVIDLTPVNYYMVDTFSVSIFDRPPVVINEKDCTQLGNEDCLTAGYFNSADAARADAVTNWNIPDTTVKTSEVSPGCWIWSQVLPCVNSCYGCPSTGYIQGG